LLLLLLLMLTALVRSSLFISKVVYFVTASLFIVELHRLHGNVGLPLLLEVDWSYFKKERINLAWRQIKPE